MPEEPQKNKQQPEPTPHFDAFSGRSNEINQQPETVPMIDNSPVNSFLEPKSEPELVNNQTASVPEASTNPIPLQDGPMTTFFTPTPEVNPEQTRVSDTLAFQQPIAQVVSSEKPKWFKRKKYIIGIIVALLLAIIVGGSAFAYISYYQKPQNVINDALINAVIAKNAIYTGKIKFAYGSGLSKINGVINIDSQFGTLGTQHHNAKLTLTIGPTSYSIQGDVLFDKVGDIYFRVQGLKTVVDEAKNSLGITSNMMLSNSIDGIVKKIDDTWFRVSTNDLNTYSKDFSKVKSCINESMDKFKNDNSAISEVAGLYKKNPYIVVKKDLGNYSYDVTTDTKAGKAFIINLKNTKIYKSLNTCDKNIVINNADVNAIPDSSTTSSTNDSTTYKITVSPWSHKIRKLDISSNSNGLVSSENMTASYDQKINISTPKPSTSITQLQTYIQQLITYSNQAPSGQTTTALQTTPM